MLQDEMMVAVIEAAQPQTTTTESGEVPAYLQRDGAMWC